MPLSTPPRLAAIRLATAVLAAAVVLGLGVGAASAQSVACTQLNTMLQSLNSNSSVQNVGQSSENLRALQANEANAERAYVRTGCQAQQDQRLPQTPQCRGIAQQILTQRAQIAQLSQSNTTGVALSRQRQQVVQQLQRYGCSNQTSGATFTGYADRQPPARRNFLQQLFGGPDAQSDYGDNDSDYTGQQAIEEPETAPTQNTIRTVCVRMSDAYYWPISYSTTRDYIPQDTATCEADCPGQKVDLYFYANPGQQPQQMIDAAGRPYASLPNAFAYRKQFDLTNTCRPRMAATTAASPAGAPDDTEAQPVVAPVAVTALPSPVTADVPLPRPRPDDSRAIAALAALAPAPPPAAAAAPPVATRVVKVGDKLVRVVGPDTPYAQGTPG